MSWKWKLILIIALAGNIFFLIKAIEYRNGANDWRDRYAHIVQEFSGREKYEKDNQRYFNSQSDRRVVFFGTQVVGRWDLGRSFPEYEAINRGIYGQWAAGLLLRFKPDVIDLKPRAVVIEISSYNLRPQYSLREIEDYVISMVDLARANNITPILSTMIPLQKDAQINMEGLTNFEIRDSILTYNSWLIDYCVRAGTHYVDFNKPLSDTNGNLSAKLSDGPIDPNPNGYKLMSSAVKSILDSLLIPNK